MRSTLPLYSRVPPEDDNRLTSYDDAAIIKGRAGETQRKRVKARQRSRALDLRFTDRVRATERVRATDERSRSQTPAAEVPARGAQASTSTRTAAAIDRPAGPAAKNLGKLTGGKGINLASGATGSVIPTTGWIEDEVGVEGTATSSRSPGPLSTDGQFTLQPDASASYRTRIVVRRSATPAKFNGTAWIGVSAQRIGVEGGLVAVRVPRAEAAGAGKKPRVLDPARYSALHHPGDAFSYDMFTQIARAVRAPLSSGLLGSLRPQRILAIGESSSAFALTTYLDGVQPLTNAFDGFLMHSRGGAAAPRPTLDATPAFVRDGAGNDREFAPRLGQVADRGPTPRALRVSSAVSRRVHEIG